MLARIILVLTLIFVGASIGHGYVQGVKPKFQFDSSTLRASLASVSATNGSTIEEIMQELNEKYVHSSISKYCKNIGIIFSIITVHSYSSLVATFQLVHTEVEEVDLSMSFLIIVVQL